MYKGGLVFALISHVYIALGLIIGAIGMSIALSPIAGTSGLPSGVVVPAVADIPSVSNPLSDIVSWIGALALIPIIQILFISLALDNLAKSEKGQAKFKKGLAIATGVLCLPTNTLAAILILVGASYVQEGTTQKQSKSAVVPQDPKRSVRTRR